MKIKIKKLVSVVCMGVLAFSGCSSGTTTTEWINPYSDTYAVRYDTESTADLTVDFSKRDGSLSQNVKKIDMFSPTWNFLKGSGLDYGSLDSLKYMREFKSESMRVDMMFGNGGIGNNSYTNQGLVGTDNAWHKVNTLTDALEKGGALPYYIMVGIPGYAQADGGNAKSYPDMEKYTEFCRNTAAYFKNSGQRIIYETWNEPDLNATSYWTSGMPLFIDTSVAAAKAYKEGDPDAYVAELGLCWPVTFCKDDVPSLGGTLWDYYMQKSAEAKNHIDAFTWHYYGNSTCDMEGIKKTSENFSYYKDAVRASINKDNDKYDLYTMTQHCTEFSPAATGSGIVVQTGIIPKLYKSIDYVLDTTDISRFSWASYLMSEFYLINPYSWEKSPVFYVLWSFGRLPLSPATVTAESGVEETFGWMTGIDSKRASAIIYNKTLNPSYSVSTSQYIQRAEDSRSISVKLTGVPFTAKNAKIYLIDNEHVSHNTEDAEPYLVMDLDENKIKNGDVVIDLKIPGNAAMYIELDDGDGQCETDYVNELKQHIVRKDYYYEERADLMPYSDIHENSFEVSLGMLGHKTGKTAINVTLDDMKSFEKLAFDYNIYGDMTGAGTNKGLGVRVDYHTANGYTTSANYYWRNYRGDFTYSGWGTGVECSNGTSFGSALDGHYEIELMENSPLDWDGRIMVTYYMVDCGENASAVIQTKGI